MIFEYLSQFCQTLYNCLGASKDARLPWQSPQHVLSPERVAQAFPSIIAAIGTPVQAPNTRGKSPGRGQGDSQPPKTRYPTVEKRASNRKKAKMVQKTAA